VKKGKDNETELIVVRDVEAVKQDLRDMKLTLEKLNDEVSHKSNIKDVCALVDMKANAEDIERTMEDLFKDLSVNYAPKQTVENLISE